MKTEIINPRIRACRTKSIETFSLMVENNIYERNIINLVKEIHENEKKMEEIQKDKKKRKYISVNPSVNQFQIKLTPLNNQTIQYILSCKLRTPNMLTILNAFLSTMKFLSVSADNEDKEKLLYSLSFCLKMDKKQNGSVIFRYGNKGTRFYIVLGGEVSVLILREKIVQLNNLNYLKYLLYLKVIKEEELAKKIICTNPKSKFKISEKHLDTYYDEILAFINKYYTIEFINESETIEKNYSNKALFKNNHQENREEDFPKGLYTYSNYLEFENIKENKENKEIKINKTFKKNFTMEEQKINVVQKRIENEKSFMEENKEKIMKFKKATKKSAENSKDYSKEKDKPLLIKYKATSKIPNYLELDISTFGPSDCAKLVNFVIKKLEQFYSKTNKVSSLDEYIRNCFIDESLTVSDRFDKKEQITIFQYFEITRKKEGDIFGELALQHNDNKRTATMIATKDSVFGYLSKNDYNNCLRGVEMKKRKNEVNFIMSFSLFDENNWVNFEKTYFNFFKKEYLSSGQVIINQNDPIDNIYFIMEGQIEITTNLNFKEINQILKQKNKRIKNKKNKNKEIEINQEVIINENNIKEHIESIENNNNEVNLDNNDNENNNNSINKEYHENKDKKVDKKKFAFLTSKQIKELNDLKSFRLCVIDNKDILGLNDICSKNGISFVKATCVSSNAVIFSLKKNILDELKRKNSEIEKNVECVSNKREKIMIERLKITTNYMFSIVGNNKIKMSEVHKIDDEKDLKNKEPRTHSALNTKFYLKMYLKYNNKITNYKYNKNLSKNLFKKSSDKMSIENVKDFSNKNVHKYNLKKKLQKKPTLNYLNGNYKNFKRDFSLNNLNNKVEKKKSTKNFNLYPDTEKNSNQVSFERKTCFQKFMDSVTERVSQIQNSVADSKFTGLFSPIYTRNIKIGPEKNKNQNNNNYKYKDSNNNKIIIDKHINYKIGNSIAIKSNVKRANTISLSNKANNYILIKKSNTTNAIGKKKSFQLLKINMQNDSLAELFKNQKHIVQHQYTITSKNLKNELENKKINIITNENNDPKKIALSEFSKKNKNIFYHSKVSKLTRFKHPKLADFNPIKYNKIILGTRYREHEVSKEQQKFSKMLTNNQETINYFSNPEFQKNINLFLNQNNKLGKYNISSKIKPTKVDLLVYNKTIENNPKYYTRNFTHEQEIKKRLCSRNVKHRTKTICFTKTFTNTANKY